ncbi:hypothetical protein CC1G_11365 [Coprinopsis cinerea okayama7|uniref:DUF7330 domain-containing protein n=1 Tax=Coprinopsis cinerea (strain Okayama-7 / 130 / ATCC MYA-4618 / FGSC 9003) TaxID=240176 RepID=A8P8X2_COPC7|nr:hypothetical protein CC1G_11365 [Coprinopsis cinerea okayama7\|eukprot:XP_001839654.2 hypothetical protein CC1G_11365 [Coprinopsis cinerea okayama7\
MSYNQSGWHNPYDGYSPNEQFGAAGHDANRPDSAYQLAPAYYDTNVRHLSPPSSTLLDTVTNSSNYQSTLTSYQNVYPRYQDILVNEGRNPTNHVSITRQAVTSGSRLLRLFYPKPKIVETFFIDPHLKVPDGVLKAVKSGSFGRGEGDEHHGQLQGSNGRRQNRQSKQRKNVKLQLIDGKMDVSICLISDDDPLSASRLRKTTSTTSNAPEPRPPFLLRARCTSEPLEGRHDQDVTGTPALLSTSPITLYLPRNIDQHLWLSPGIRSTSRVMHEDTLRRGYFLGDVPDVDEGVEDIMEEGEDGEDRTVVEGRSQVRPVHHRRMSSRTTTSASVLGDGEEWLGDKVELDVEDGIIRVLFEDERLEGVGKWSSKGWRVIL